MQGPETIEKLAYDGPLSATWLIMIGCVILLVSGFMCWRDCRAAGKIKLFPFLMLLRASALGIALWMLAGATTLTLSRNLKPKSVILMVDASGSMDAVDSVDGSGNAVGWSGDGFPEIRKLDAITGNLRSAQAALTRLPVLIRSDDSDDAPERVWGQILDSIQSAADDLGGVSIDAEPRAELRRAGDLLKAGVRPLRDHRIESASAARAARRETMERVEEARALVTAGVQRVEAVTQRLRIDSEGQAAVQTRLAAQSRLARKDKVAAWLQDGEQSWIKAVEEQARVLRYSFSSQVVPVSAGDWAQALKTAPGANVTDLNAAVERAARDASGRTIDAVVLVTDGGHNASGSPIEMAAALRGVPLYVVPIGNSKMPRDVILHHTHAPRAVFRNDQIVVESMITAYNCEGETVRVELLSGGEVLDSRTNIVQSAIHDHRVTFQRTASEPGRQKYQVRAIPISGEHSPDNNEGMIEVDVMEDVIRVLVADDRPRWEFRYLVALFKRDKHVEFEQLLFDPHDPAAGIASFPDNLEGWRKYRVVILGDVTPSQLTPSQQELLRTYVAQEGGNLICIAGESGMPAAFAGQPLGAMIPVLPGAPPGAGTVLAVTAEGAASIATQLDDDLLASARIWRDMSGTLPVYLPSGARAKATARVLIEARDAAGGAGEPHAFLSWQYVGLGRVIHIAAPVTYQLRYRNGDRNHHRFWGQLLRWAIARDLTGGSRTVRITTDKAAYEAGDLAQVTVHLAGVDGAPVAGARFNMEARQGSQAVKVIEMQELPTTPGVYRAAFEDLPIGQIWFRAAGPAVDQLLSAEGYREPAEQLVTVDPKGTGEQSSPVCNLPLLRQIADAAGGAVVSPASIPNALSPRNTVPDYQQAVLNRSPMWNRWPLLWIFAGCLTLEWMARRYWRMV